MLYKSALDSASSEWKVPRNETGSGHWGYMSAAGCRLSTNCPCNFGLILIRAVVAAHESQQAALPLLISAGVQNQQKRDEATALL